MVYSRVMLKITYMYHHIDIVLDTLKTAVCGSSIGCTSAWYATVAGSILTSGNILSWSLVMK